MLGTKPCCLLFLKKSEISTADNHCLSKKKVTSHLLVGVFAMSDNSRNAYVPITLFHSAIQKARFQYSSCSINRV